ncbi:MAG: SH3 domain-containing protein, partial [Chloroflexi bacterium]|nr:SH3 domain-containing protein [Chloroflexota bacterium]
RQTACSAVNVRTGASTSATRLTSLGAGVKVTVVARVTGLRWRASCAGKDVSGTAWYRISAIGGTSVASRYGVRYVYAAGGLFEAVP